ncbi:MAG TPA: hypothetical protein VGJ86_09415 [Acidimicrobiales bacterium]
MPTGGGPPQRLNQAELALILRRAAELEDDGGRLGGSVTDHFDIEAVEAAASEVGLSPLAVRRALAELRAGALPEVAPSPRRVAPGSRLVGTRSVVETRMVRATPEVTHAALDQFLRHHNFECRRRLLNKAIYRARYDVVAYGRWLLNVGGVRRVTGVDAIEVTVEPVGGDGGGAMVRMVATLRPGLTPLVVAASGSGVMVAGIAGLVALVTREPAVLLVGSTAGGAMALGGFGVRGRWRRRRGEQIGEVLAAVLDGLDQPRR